MKQSAGPARPRADGAVNFKTAVNPAKASASRAECLVSMETTTLPRFTVFYQCGRALGSGKRFSFFCLSKEQKITVELLKLYKSIIIK
jgi:hypothetical protein